SVRSGSARSARTARQARRHSIRISIGGPTTGIVSIASYLLAGHTIGPATPPSLDEFLRISFGSADTSARSARALDLHLEPAHAERAGGRERAPEETPDPRAIGPAAAGEQHVRVLVLGARPVRPAAEPRVRHQRLLEMPG